jgi:hypothetical protein
VRGSVRGGGVLAGVVGVCLRGVEGRGCGADSWCVESRGGGGEVLRGGGGGLLVLAGGSFLAGQYCDWAVLAGCPFTARAAAFGDS